MSRLAGQVSATFPICLSGAAPLPIPPKPPFQDFQFKIIGKEPALLMRLSNEVASHVDDIDIDDIYEELPLPSSNSVATENGPNTFSRPTLLQALGGDEGLTDANGHAATIVRGRYRVDVSPLPTSPQSVPSTEAVVIPKPFPNTASRLSLSQSSGHRVWTVPQANCATSSSYGIQDFGRSVRESRTCATSGSHHLSPPPNELVVPASDHARIPDLRLVDNSKALKKVVALKDKFKAVSTTARQSQRLAKQALISAQRSVAAAQSCLAAAESFAPCVGDVISAIRRMVPADGAYGSASEWIAVLRDLEEDLRDLKQWSSIGIFDTFRRGAVAPRLRNTHTAPLPGGNMDRASCSGFPLTSVEEEAQEAFRAWNELDRQIHDTADDSSPRREPGPQSGDGVSPKSSIHDPHRLGMEDESEISRHQEVKGSGNRVSEELAEASTRSLQEILREAGRQSVAPEAAMQPGGEVEEEMPLEIRTEAADSKDSQERPASRDDQIQDQQRQQPAQTFEESQHSPASRIKETASVSTAACGASKNSAPQDRGALSLQAALATPIVEDQMPTSPNFNLSSSDDTQAKQQPPSLPPAQSKQLAVTPRNGNTDATNTLSASPSHPSTPVPTTYSYSKSEAVASDDGETGSVVMLRSKIISTEAGPSDRCQDTSPAIKSEPVEPQWNLEMQGKKVIDEPPASNESLSEAVEVKPVFDISLKPDSETPVGSLASPDESEIGTRPECRVSSVDLPAPLPQGLLALKQPVETDTPPPSTVPVISASVKVTTPLTSPHDVTNNNIPSAQPTTPVSSSSPASPSPIVSLAAQSATISQPVSAPVHVPTSSAIPLALRVEKPIYPKPMRDLDDSISPDLMSSRGWDADENDGSRRGSRRSLSKCSPIRRSPRRFESVPRSRSRGVGSRNQSVDYGRRSVVYPVAPGGRQSISDEHPAPLIGKKRPRDEAGDPGPPSSRRDWTRRPPPFVSENQMSHITSVSQVGNGPHRPKRLEPLGSCIIEPGYNSNNNSQSSGPSLIHRLDHSSHSTVEVANSPERRIQRPFRPQQPPQNRHLQNSGYNMDHRPPSNSRQSHHSYYDGRTPELLTRMLGSQQFQNGQNPFESGHSYSNVGWLPPNRPHGRGRGQGGAFQQQRFSRGPPSLFDRLDNRH